jgi:rhamnosyl/mannosyltransferase
MIDRRLKVLHIGKFYPPHRGGIETHLETLAGELCKRVDLRVVVASDNRKSVREIVGGVSVSRVPTWFTVASTPICMGMIRELRRSDADVVHLHFPNPTAVLAYLASGYGGCVVVTYHCDTVRQKVLGPLFAPYLHAALRRSSAIITTSPEYKGSSPVLLSHLDRCHVIPFGVEVSQFEHADPAAVYEIRRQYGERLVLSVGRLVYYKGFEYLIRAMTRVDGTLMIVGEGPLRGKLEQLTRDLDITAKIKFLGGVPDVIPYYHAADLFTLASIARSEAFGIVQIEAMAAGLPVVNTKLNSGVPFVSQHGQTGFTVTPRDPVALGDAISKLLDDSELRRAYGHAARLRAQQEFSLETMVRRTLSLYESVLAGTAPIGKGSAENRA